MAKLKDTRFFDKTIVFLTTTVILLMHISRVQCQGLSCTNSGECGSLSECSPQQGTCRCVTGAFSTTALNTNCLNSSIPNPNCSLQNCLYCPQSACVRCIDEQLLYTGPDGSQTCYVECPGGTSPEVNAAGVVTRRICRGEITQPGASSIDQTVLIAVICVIVGVLLLMTSAFALYCLISFFLRRRSRGFDVHDSTDGVEVRENIGFRSNSKDTTSALTGRKLRDPHDVEFAGNNRQSVMFEDDEYVMFSQSGHSEDMIVFLTKLNELRKYSTDFLRMLNDMRRRLKELPTESSAAKSYRNVMGDITRLLFLLNKKPSNIEMPPDGMQLLEWSEQTLQHYLDSQKRAVARKRQQEQVDRSGSPSSNPRLSSYGGQVETHF